MIVGIAAVGTFTRRRPRNPKDWRGWKEKSGTDAWLSKYIFPNSMLPTAQEIPEACAGKFVIEDWHNLGGYYIKTLRAWYQNFIANWNVLKKH